MTQNQKNSTFSLNQYYRKKAAIIDTLLHVFLALLIVFVPLPFGSVQSAPIFAIQIVAGVCFLLWIVKLVAFGRPQEVQAFREYYKMEKESFRKTHIFHRFVWLRRFFQVITLGRWPRKNIAAEIVITSADIVPQKLKYYSVFGYPVKNTGMERVALLFLCLLIVQLIPIPSFVMRLISPATSDLYRSAAAAIESSRYFYPISLDPYVTFSKILEFLSYFMLFLVVVNNARTVSFYRTLVVALIVSTVFQAAYGLYEFLSGHQHIFSYAKKYNTDVATGTFINRNHYAAYLEICIPLILALAVSRITQLRVGEGRLGVRIVRFLDTKGSQVILLLLLTVLISLALLFSMSRSGICFAFLSSGAFFYFYRRMKGRMIARSYWLLAVLCALAVGAWIGLEPIVERFFRSASELTLHGSRLSAWKDTVRIFLHFPVAGTGIGTFREIFPMYQSFVSSSVYLQTHNDYLQILSEGGVFVFFLIVSTGEAFWIRMKSIVEDRLSRLSILQIGAFCSLLSFALHGLTDFSFQIPAIAVTIAIVAGLFFGRYYVEKPTIRP